MMPWLPNLSKFCHSSKADNDQENSKTKEVLRNLIDLTIARTDVSVFYFACHKFLTCNPLPNRCISLFKLRYGRQ